MKHLISTLGLLVAFGSAVHALPNATEIIPAKGGAIRITPIYHASLQIEWKDTVFHIDPSSGGDYTGAKKPDIILVTDVAHADKKAIVSLTRRSYDDYDAGCKIFGPRTVASQLKPLEVEENLALSVDVLESNISSYIENDELYSVDAVPTSNRSGQRGFGYVLTLGGKRIYIAGDTQITPEMKTLKNIDIAFLPMNSSSNMTPQQAAIAARAFKPKVVYPYNYRLPSGKTNDNPQQFAKALEGSGIKVKLRGWYAHPALATVTKPKQ